MEPPRFVPDLESSSDYLNIPWMAVYSDPLYAELDHPVIDTKQNRDVLNMAIDEGDAQMVTYLLSKGVGSFESALERAIDSDQLKIFQLLWADPLNKTKITSLPFSKAVQADALEIVKYLAPTIELSPGILADFWAEAVQAMAEKVMAYLLQTHHQDIDFKSNWDEALAEDNPELIRFLYPYMPFEEVFASVEDGIIDHSNNAVKFLLELDEFTEFLPEFLAWTAENENLAIVEYLAGRIDPSVNDNAALKNAVRVDDVDITNFLLADPRVHPETIKDTDGSLRAYLQDTYDDPTPVLLE
jgi:hypothetical protein